MTQFLNMNIHNVDRVSLGDTHGLIPDTGKPVQVRNITVRSGGTTFIIALFADDARTLDIVMEG